MDKRVAIVTGGSRGIGQAVVRRLAADGLHVVAIARDAARLADLCRGLSGEGHSVESITCDVADGPALGKAIEQVADRHGRIDVLVNNAGITRDGLLLRMEDEDFDQVLRVNLRSAFVTTRAAARYLMRSPAGRIINIGSVSGVIGNAGQANYSASKAALTGFSKSVAKELAGKQVTCNVVAPGFITTDMTDALSERIRDKVKELIPMRRFGGPADVAAVVSFLASEQAGYLTAQVICVDGGMT